MTTTARVVGPPIDDVVLTPAALELVADLERRFGPRRRELLAARAQRAEAIARSGRIGFLPETRELRDDTGWSVAPLPADLRNRRVEITGPTDPKMAINALNSGAQIWLADFEDANAPTWANLVGGQRTLHDAARGRLEHTAEDGREYRVTAPKPPTVVARPRGWHLPERHVLVDDGPVTAALFDAAVYASANATELRAQGALGPYFYLPKLESHLEARLWAEVFGAIEDAVGIPPGSIRATVLVETITAAFEMDEILYELRDHAAGLNAGRWDYLFSLIKRFRTCGPDFVLPDRNAVTMTAPFMRRYTDLLVETCHARGAMAIGGMAAFIPSRRDPAVNEAALAKVRADKDREAGDGFDGSWVAHPDLVPICRDAFDAVLGDEPNQLHRRTSISRPRDEVLAAELLDVRSAGAGATADGLRNNVSVAIQYLESWLRGHGAVGLFNLMEDVATAEIARSQLWQWIAAGTVLGDGTVVTRELVAATADDVLAGLDTAAGRWADARKVFDRLVLDDDYIEFLTDETYPLID